LLIAGITLVVMGLSVQAGAIARMAALRRLHRDNPDWEHSSDFTKWRVIEPLGGGTALLGSVALGIAQAPTPLLAACFLIPIVLFGVSAFVGGGEGEGAN